VVWVRHFCSETGVYLDLLKVLGMTKAFEDKI